MSPPYLLDRRLGGRKKSSTARNRTRAVQPVARRYANCAFPTPVFNVTVKWKLWNYAAISGYHSNEMLSVHTDWLTANCCCYSPVLSFLAPSPTGLTTVFYCPATLGVNSLHEVSYVTVHEQTSEQSFVSLYGVYSVNIKNILTWRCVVLGRTNRVLSFDTSRIAEKTKKLGRIHRQQGDLISLKNYGGYTDKQTARRFNKLPLFFFSKWGQ
jgi:hypothetical protein